MKLYHYFEMPVIIYRNSNVVAEEIHGIYGTSSNPLHGVNKMKDILKGQWKNKFPNDIIDVSLAPIGATEVTKEFYEAKYGPSI